MALLIQQTSTTKQASTAPFKIARFKVEPFNLRTKLVNTILTLSAAIGAMSLSACQTAPTIIKPTPAQTSVAQNQQPAAKPSVTATQAPIIKSDDDKYSTEPYPAPKQPAPAIPPTEAEQVYTPVHTLPTQSPIITQPDNQDTIILTPSREDYLLSEPSIPSHNELLERARQNSQQRSQQSTANNSNLPAFRNLMQTGTEQLKSGNLNGAESSFTRAQRLAPKSSAVYFYLAQVALKKNQPRKAEAMARRGLTVAQDSTRRRALWQIILQSGQAQGNGRVINEAKQALR
ncbi:MULTISPECIES: tetratricopeptide repeat protein [unclassified Psychrobacter]|uniref:tetratricopeptide repeat protein n=1 Tax=unclassified Psychrobacter TaxID=196806 RepID=UPI0025D41C2E|nr:MULTISPECIES: tetratricopeptide repeat protein [unclassified Psychrobacter]